MATTYHTEIQKLYVAYFNRPADFGGLNYWETVVEAAGGSTAAVSAEFAKSAEYKAEYAGMSNADIINQIYINLFGRAAEPTGLAYWANGITNGNFTIDTAVTTIAAAAQGTDKVAFDSKVTFATAFTNALDTPAEQAAYSGDLANEAAKEIVADIKTATDLAAAIAPAALSASVVAVVKAATPFTLASGLAALDAAKEAKADFLDEVEMTDVEIDALVDDADADLDVLVDGDYVLSSPAVAAALLSDEIEQRAAAVETEQGQYEAAVEAASDVDGLTDAIAAMTAAQENEEAMVAVELEAQAALAAAEASYEVKNGVAIVVTAEGEVAGVIELNDDGELELVTGVTETSKPGVTALLAASIALQAATADAEGAAIAADDAALLVDLLDLDTATVELANIGGGMTLIEPADVAAPTFDEIIAERAALEAVAAETGDPLDAQAVVDFNALVTAFVDADADPLAQAVTDEAAQVEAAVEAVAELDEAIAAVAEAEAVVAQRDDLDDAVAAAEAEFTAAELKLPVELLAFNAATSGSDIFLAGDIAAATVVSFGAQGIDSLFIGSEYTLNTGALSTGNNAVLEAFMIQSGTSVKVYLETEVYGSDTALVAEQVITLTGVTVAELTLANGIITAA